LRKRGKGTRPLLPLLLRRKKKGRDGIPSPLLSLIKKKRRKRREADAWFLASSAGEKERGKRKERNQIRHP